METYLISDSSKDAVDEAIALFSGEDTDKAKEIWLVDPAPEVIDKYEKAVDRVKYILCNPMDLAV